MPVRYADALKRDRLDVVTEAIDAGSDVGYIEIGTGVISPWTFATTLVKVNLLDPSFANAATMLGTTFIAMDVPVNGLSGVATGTGVATVARLCDSDDNIVVSGLVVGNAIGSGIEIAVGSTSISANQTVTVTQGTITHV